MPDITGIEQSSFGGKEGFTITWEMVGFSEEGARFRAVAMTAMRFPTTITEAEVVNVREFGSRDFDVEVFVPTEGFGSAGIKNPVSWVKDRFSDKELGIS